MQNHYSCIILVFILLLFGSHHSTAQYRIPQDANVVNVKDYGAKGNGKNDDTKAIQEAIKYALSQGIRFDYPKFVYFPKGTYLVSSSIEGRVDESAGNRGWRAGTILVGEDQKRTIIKLKNGANGFNDKAKPKAVIKTGSENHRGDGQGNEAFRNSVISMTIDVGSGNRGAVGISYLANNRGTIENVTIKGTESGYCGIRMVREWPGPCLLKNVAIAGFDLGMEFGHIQYGVTMEHIRLKNQRVAAIHNRKNVLSIRKLFSQNRVPVFTGMETPSNVVLIDSELKYGGAKNTAIATTGNLTVRNTRIQGYGTAITGGRYGGTIKGGRTAVYVKEYLSNQPVSQFESARRTLNLPIEETPTYHTDNLSKWANVSAYGNTAGSNDSEAIQKAIDSGKEIIYFPNGVYQITKPIVVRKNVKKLVGFQSSIVKSKNFVGDEAIRFEGTASSYTILEHLRVKGKIKHHSKKTLVLRHLDFFQYENTSKGTGKLFIEDVMGKPFRIRYGQKVWARQLNVEAHESPLIKVENSTLWLLGYKTERPVTVLETVRGATEVLGGLIYPLATTDRPAFIAKDAKVSYCVLFNGRSSRGVNKVFVKETQNGKTKSIGGANRYTPLYVGGLPPDETSASFPEKIPEGIYKIRPASAPKKVVAVKKANGRGDNVQQSIDQNQPHQRWRVTRVGTRYYRLSPMHDRSLAMDVASRGTKNGTNVQVWSYNQGEVNRYWKIYLEDTKNGYYSLAPRHTIDYNLDMRLDVKGSSTADGANIQLYKSNNSKAQRFILELVEGANTRTSEATAKPTASPEKLVGTEFGLYPNPAHRSVQLNFPKAETAQFQLFDLTGRLLMHESYTNQQTINVMIDELLSGVYVVRLHADGESYQQRLMVE